MALVASDAAMSNPASSDADTGHTKRYALIKVRDGAVLADGDEVFTNRDAAVEAFTRARALGWDLYATPGLLAGGADRDVTELDVSSLAAVPENVLRRAYHLRELGALTWRWSCCCQPPLPVCGSPGSSAMLSWTGSPDRNPLSPPHRQPTRISRSRSIA